MFVTICPQGYSNQTHTYRITQSQADQALLATIRARQAAAECDPDDHWRMTEHETSPVPGHKILPAEQHVWFPFDATK